MVAAKPGDRVKVHYTGKLEDGSVFDSSADREPLEFTIGQQEVIPGFESAVVGMSPGDSKTENIPIDRAYGPRRDDMVISVDRKEIPDDIPLQVGQRLRMSQEGHQIIVTVAEVSPENVTLDANHPLAGQNLVFDIELVEIGA
jgi:peptidylprolyl isomerase